MNNSSLIIKRAARDDIPTIVRLLAQDEIAGSREKYEQPLPQEYFDAFEEITRSESNELVVAEIDGEVVGSLQLTFIPYLTAQGGRRALVEAVFVDERFRGQGIGRELMQWAIARAQEKGCHMVQLTTNRQRPEAHRFYESLGFAASHTGMKLYLPMDSAPGEV